MSLTTKFAEAVRTVELGAERIYRKQAESSDNPGVKAALLKLAEDEARHAELARHLAGKPGNAAHLEASRVAVGKLMKFILEESESIGRRFESSRSDWELFNTALGMEKDSVLLYGSMMSRIAFAPLRRQIEQVLLQEKNHFDKLWTLRAAALRGLGKGRARLPGGPDGQGEPTRFSIGGPSWSPHAGGI